MRLTQLNYILNNYENEINTLEWKGRSIVNFEIAYIDSTHMDLHIKMYFSWEQKPGSNIILFLVLSNKVTDF